MPKFPKVRKKAKAKQRPKVEVVAPSDMEQGYRFYVDTDEKKSLLVEVPKGGVTEGETFQAKVINEVDRGEHNIPFGRWRDGLFGCFKHGLCHPQWWFSCWCQLCALGQVLTRLQLDICGLTPQTGQKIMLSPFKIMCMIAAAFWFSLIVISVVILLLKGDGGSAHINADGTETIKEGKSEPERLWIAIWFRVFLAMITFIFAWIATINTRAHIRHKHDIPITCCRSCEDTCCSLIANGLILDDVRKHCCSCEDMCCSLWCGPCTICQMARHTADYEKYSASCCIDDGLKLLVDEEREDEERAPEFDASENVPEDDIPENPPEEDVSENVPDGNDENDDPSDSPEEIV